MAHLAFILSQFPEMHETFILRELVGLRQQGQGFSIYSLKACRDSIVHVEVESLMPQVHYSPFLLSWRVLRAQLRYLFRSPGAYIGALWSALRSSWKQPVVLAKLLAAFPKSVRFAADMEDEGVTHLHAHWATIPTSVTMVIAKLTGIPFSFTAHAWDIYVRNPTLDTKLARARFVVTCTGHNKEHLETLQNSAKETEILLNYHGIDLTVFAAPDMPLDSRHGILSIGRMVEQKGFVWLLQAVRLVRDRGHEIPCLIVGKGPEKQRLSALIRELGLQDLVSLADPLPQESVRDLYRKSRMFVLPSVIAQDNDRDGIPNVLVEAMAMGLPVLSSRVSGIPELVVHEQTGLLADQRDAEGIADGIVRLQVDHELWTLLQRQGRQKVEQMFDVDQNVSELIRFFRRHGAIS